MKQTMDVLFVKITKKKPWIEMRLFYQLFENVHRPLQNPSVLLTV